MSFFFPAARLYSFLQPHDVDVVHHKAGTPTVRLWTLVLCNESYAAQTGSSSQQHGILLKIQEHAMHPNAEMVSNRVIGPHWQN